MEIAIHYDPARGFEEPALILARRLFARYDEAIASLTLVPDPNWCRIPTTSWRST